VRVVITNGIDYFYLLKVVKEGSDVYCIIPRLGVHHSLHESGASHFRTEKVNTDPSKQPPLVMTSGSARFRKGDDFVVAKLQTLDSVSEICTVIYSSIGNLNEDDYRCFNRNTKGCFVIDIKSLPKDTSGLLVGVWAITKRGESKFRFNNPDISEYSIGVVI